MILDLDQLEQRFGARDALVSPHGVTTYAQLVERVRERVAELARQGVGRGERVALVCAQEIDVVVSVLALLERGCILLPLGGATPPPERERLARAFRATWVLDGVPPAAPRASLAGPEADGPTGEGLVLALASSGSTGAPKLVLHTAQQLRARVDSFLRALALRCEDRVLAVVPLEHAFGQTLLLGALRAGACLVFPASPHPRGIARITAEQGLTLLPGPATLFELMARHRREGWPALAGARAAMSAASALSLATHAAFTAAFGIPLWQSYGANEAGGICLNRSGASRAGELALGEPYPGVEVAICDAEGRELPEGTTGDIVVRTPALALGYQGDADGASRIAEGRFFTGDLGMRRGGLFFFRGRRKLMIEWAGRKVNPLEVEHALRRHPDVEDAAVVAHPTPGRDVVKAIVVARRPVAAEALMEFCGRDLAPYKVPRIVEFRASLPRNALGKLAREEL